MYNTDESFFTLPYKLCSPYLTAIGGYVTGYASTEYISEETPMAAYANVHLALEAMRVKTLLHAQIRASPETATPEDLKEDAENGPSDAPRVLILGPENSGKTTVAKILVNYATRSSQDWCPILVNVDPSEVRACFHVSSDLPLGVVK